MRIERVEVFGSVAKGEASPGSDLEQLLGCAVDLLTRRSVERSDNLIRRHSILDSAREVYAG